MLRFLRWLFTGDGHAHKWEIIDTVKIYEDANDKMPHTQRKVLQCSICGDIKKVDI